MWDSSQSHEELYPRLTLTFALKVPSSAFSDNVPNFGIIIPSRESVTFPDTFYSFLNFSPRELSTVDAKNK